MYGGEQRGDPKAQQGEAVQSYCPTLKSPGGPGKEKGGWILRSQGAQGVSPALAVTAVPGLFSCRQSPPAVGRRLGYWRDHVKEIEGLKVI